MSSSGVETYGGSKPAVRQISLTRGRIEAFARWVQFHVSKLSIPLTAAIQMCSASAFAFGGNAASRRSGPQAPGHLA